MMERSRCFITSVWAGVRLGTYVLIDTELRRPPAATPTGFGDGAGEWTWSSSDGASLRDLQALDFLGGQFSSQTLPAMLNETSLSEVWARHRSKGGRREP